MKFYRFDKGYRYLSRYRRIVGVFGKYGFAQFLDQLSLAGVLRIGSWFRKSARSPQNLSAATRVRMALEELGPTFIKIGQLLSTRSFLLPPQFIDELSRLQDDVRPFSFQAIHRIIETDLGDPQAHFSFIDPDPIASASIAQVHRALLQTGESVIIKVQRPQLAGLIQIDMDILHDLAVLIQRHVEEADQYDPVGMVTELRRSMLRELDFSNEARSIELFSSQHRHNPHVHVPRLYWDLCSPRVITMEFIDGIKITHLDEVRQAGIPLRDLAHHGTQFILRQIFEKGFFHADPHPGNLFVTRQGRIAPVDFGIMGRLDEWMMAKISDLVIGVWRRDVDLIIRVLVDLGALSIDIDHRSLQFELSEYLHRYYGLPLSRINMKQLMQEGIDLVSRHRLRIPTNLMLLAKTIGTYEDLGRQLDPEFNLLDELRPYIKKLVLRRLDPEKIGYESAKTLRDLYDLGKMVPRELELILRRMRQGRFAIELQHRGIQTFIREMDRSFNRLSLSLIIAALVVSSSLIMIQDRGALLFGYPVLGVIGYLFAAVLGVGLIITILRRGKL
ncbi:AarF/ABC1/UbiB kinase family protein [candidate division KSB1 bacterium]|nr:AarF/ABC1/UbiB kinase family protein [candidate division KSB1 bacterium]